MKIARGSTRTVLLTNNYAFKFPTWHSWPLFLQGLLANMQEQTFGTIGWDGVCPVRWAIPGGLLVVMPRAFPIPNSTWEEFDVEAFTHREHYTIPAEHKQNSFGILNGKIVTIDYG